MSFDNFDIAMMCVIGFGVCVLAFGWWLTHCGDDSPRYPNNHGLAFDSKPKDA